MSKKLSLIPTTVILSMSSLEIAELTGKQHNHVIRDIEKMFKDLEIDASNFGSIYKDAYKRDKKCYNLDKHYTMVLMTGYSVILRDKVLRRWQALEDKEIKRVADELRLIEERKDSKQLFRKMTDVIKATNDENGHTADKWLYVNEANMINNIIFGMTSAKIRQSRNVPKDALIRDYMGSAELELINELQNANALYYQDGDSFADRKRKLKKRYEQYCKRMNIEPLHLIG